MADRTRSARCPSGVALDAGELDAAERALIRSREINDD
jgi:hypothetical protein